MNGVIYTLRLDEPVLANSLAGDTNSARSLPCLPGGVIRGAVIGNYLAEQNLPSVDATEPTFRRLFLSGQTQFLTAYPLEEDARTLPVPLSLKVSKRGLLNGQGQARNLAERDSREVDLEDFPTPLGRQYGAGEAVYRHEMLQQINVHTQRDAVVGRATVDAGAVYRYEALPAGTRLRGFVLTETEDDAQQLKGLLADRELLLGKARTAGYGRVVVEEADLLPTNWRERDRWWPPPPEDTDVIESDETLPTEERVPPLAVGRFILTLLSPALVRDKNGQLTADPLYALGKRLKRTDLKAERIFRAREIVGGFNRTWGLQLPQAGAIAAGSVFVLSTGQSLPVSELEALEAKGLGERRSEGFGRLTIDFEQPEEVNWQSKDESPAVPEREAIVLTGVDQKLALLMLRRLLRRELDERLAKAVRGYKIEQLIRPSQLARWQGIIRSTLATGDTAEKRQRITRFHAEEVKKNSPAWQQFQRARVGKGAGGQRLAEWINDVLAGENSPWRQLGYAKDEIPTKQFKGFQGKLDDNGNAELDRSGKPVLVEAVLAEFSADAEMVMEYRLRLIEAVLAAKARQVRQERKERNNA